MSKKSLPNLDGLGGFSLGGLSLGKIITKAQLKGLGFSAIGGAGGQVVYGMAKDSIGKLPLIGSLDPNITQALVGIIGGRVLYRFNEAAAHGFTGNVAGGAIANFVMNTLGLSSPLSEVVSLPGAPGSEELQLGAGEDVEIDPSELSEIEQTQQLGDMGASLEPVQSLGWL